MKIERAIIATLCLALASSGGWAAEQEKSSEEPVVLAKSMVEAMAGGDFSGASKDFASELAVKLQPTALARAWVNLVRRAGDYHSQLGARSERFRHVDIVYVVCRFEKSVVDVKVVFDRQGKIVELWFHDYTLEEYVNLDAFEERAIMVGAGEWELPGTVSMPKDVRRNKGVAGVVLVHGSGPQDREESIGPNKPFRDLAWGLASKGIAVVRYEKRTKVYGEKLAGTKGDDLTTSEEVVEDARAAIELLRNDPGVDANRIFVLGHSFGGALLPRVAKGEEKLAGLICLAGPTRALEDVLLQQSRYAAELDGVISPVEEWQLHELKRAVAAVKKPGLSREMARDSFPLRIPASYWLDIRGYHPGKAAKELKVAMLILRGERDYQVTEADLAGWKEHLSGRKDVSFKSYAKLNHLFIAGEGKPTPEEYAEPGHVGKEVIEDIATWIGEH